MLIAMKLEDGVREGSFLVREKKKIEHLSLFLSMSYSESQNKTFKMIRKL